MSPYLLIKYDTVWGYNLNRPNKSVRYDLSLRYFEGQIVPNTPELELEVGSLFCAPATSEEYQAQQALKRHPRYLIGYWNRTKRDIRDLPWRWLLLPIWYPAMLCFLGFLLPAIIVSKIDTKAHLPGHLGISLLVSLAIWEAIYIFTRLV